MESYFVGLKRRLLGAYHTVLLNHKSHKRHKKNLSNSFAHFCALLCLLWLNCFVLFVATVRMGHKWARDR